jgi:hypothetical protein
LAGLRFGVYVAIRVVVFPIQTWVVLAGGETDIGRDAIGIGRK